MKQNLTIGVLIVAIFAVVGFAVKGSSQSSSVGSEEANNSQPTAEQTKSDAKVKIEDLVPGTGQEAKTGDTVVVNYKGTLTDGTQFDSSYGREPFTLQLGAGSVIKGWEDGIPGMKVGGKRKLTIPPELGYGAQSQGSIPPNSTLIFEIDLLEIK